MSEYFSDFSFFDIDIKSDIAIKSDIELKVLSIFPFIQFIFDNFKDTIKLQMS